LRSRKEEDREMRQGGTEIDGPVRRTIVKSTAENPRTAGKNPKITLGLAS
jgi:hypothetical protein